ncbi:MAG: FISUMP domain-containing protein [Bacteroidota bacterium]
MKKTLAFLLTMQLPILMTPAQTVTDIDGNTYHTITVGTQVWTKENLKTTHFNNGDLIGTTSLPVNNDSTSIYQWSYNEDSTNILTYGRLYSWYAVMDVRSVCPTGWHIPNDTDFITLANFLGGDTIAGNKMKEMGTNHWLATNTNVTNSSDFTGLPGGFRGNSNVFQNMNTMANFWSSTSWGSSSFPRAISYNLQSNSSSFNKSVSVSNCGLSVRCIKNSPTSIDNLLNENIIEIFPNPTHNKINITIHKIEHFDVSIYNLSGILVLQKSFSEKISTIDLDTLPKGMYIVKILGKNSNVVRKLLIE